RPAQHHLLDEPDNALRARRQARPRILPRSQIRFRVWTGVLLHDQGSGWDHRKVLLSLVYRSVRGLFGLLTVLVRTDLSKDVELVALRHENQVLRRQLGDRPR
ncbi:hypothetical protein ACFPZ0_28620, partial [Streptomonospora nanhaiensis]|uniref:hypothetical protein n=1 Tax=Streptomonospora nanhaiensis TaxID=1323731 RepID=UPI003608A692